MPIDAEWLAAIASSISAAVICITAIAAFQQIRQLRTTNEIEFYLRLFDRLDSPETAQAFRTLESFAERLRTDSDLRHRMARDRHVPEFAEFSALLQFFETLSTASFEHLAMRARDYIESGDLKRFRATLRRDPKMGGFAVPEGATREGRTRT